jgi:hypothetical protein
MLISEVEKMSVLLPFFGESFAFSFIESSRCRGVLKTLRRCLGGEDAVGAIEVAVASASMNVDHPYSVVVTSMMGQ